ncbi:hypothetical protein BDV24DRAFT_173169 [Aspergillus arachidicola]|uniref:Trichothecene 3-O-acetyltransferase-like N-terminal domain-containing protein n=1 Tax=Aspergillus arachidicola TaxID=656916 RepID=A0A5N6YPE4_9EURO|nr:hypothetical protein BDV24DRAFT_173169 [Aspergillus arachidicola]
MTNHVYVEQLTPLDLPMPRTYIRVLLVFETAIATPALPWLSGQVFPATSIQHKASLEIRSNAGHTRTLVDKGSIAASYTALSSHVMPMEAIPSEIWPVPSMIDDALSATGAPVFAASLFLFSDQGVGLCVCLHHNAVDATGFTEIVRLWARSFSDPGFEFSNPPQGRLERLSKALSTYPEEISSLLSKDLFALHPKYSKVLPAMPTEFPSCTSKLFKVSIHRINVLNETLVLLCALIWTTITRVRANRNPAIASETSRLKTANPYFGNAVLYFLTNCSVELLVTSDKEALRSLADICDCSSESESHFKINSRHVAEAFRSVDCIEDYSWADLDLYTMHFGPVLGRPKFVIFPCMVVDGVAIILPRQRDSSEEEREIMVMLRRDDMGSLESDSMWRSLISEDDNQVS